MKVPIPTVLWQCQYPGILSKIYDIFNSVTQPMYEVLLRRFQNVEIYIL